MTATLLVIPGSTRAAAYSKQLARAVALSEPADAAVTVVDLADYAIPLYDGDLEEASGLPGGVLALRSAVLAHDAVLFASPEHNASIPAVLKNAIDWVSRSLEEEPGVVAWAGKVAGLLSSSPGALGGLRGLAHLRQVLMNVGMQVVTEQFALGSAHEAFAEDGRLAAARNRAGVDEVVASVLRMTRALS